MASLPQGNILLIVPPFQTSVHPALGVSQLKANLQEEGFPTTILYLNLRFAERIGLDLCEWIFAHTFNTLFGEFIFSDVLFHRSDEEIARYVEQVLAGSDAGDSLRRFFPHESFSEILRRLMQEASTFCCEDAMKEIFAHDPWMIGLTSSFQQNCSSLALIRHVKQKRPEIVTAMGGANCSAEMGEEVFRRFSEVDYIGQGECDHSFVNLVRSLREGNEPPDVPGILSRAKGRRARAAQPLQSEDLNRLPYPDFSDYFAQLARVSMADRIVPGLLMETSRGCWWGAKQRCVFCGLVGEEIEFRSKSASRAMDEMAALVSQYGVRYVSMSDNILNMKFFKTLLPKLADHPIAEIFCETKANLSKPQVRLLARSRIRWINPGIESLSDGTLRLMRKGTTKIQNIQLLKWCAESGIWVSWNYLYGLPGERKEELAQLAQDVEAVHHLQPPFHASPIRMDRFSPYFNAPGMYGLEPVRPAEQYRHVYPFPNESLKRIAYCHQSDFFAGVSKGNAFKTLKGIVKAWQKAYRRSYLVAIPRKSSLIIIDTRSCAQRYWHRLVGVRRRVYEFCDQAHTLPEIRSAVGSVRDGELESILDRFLRAKLMLHASGRYLSLAVDPGTNCGKVADAPSGPFVKPANLPGRLRQKLLRLLTLRMPPREIGAGVARRASTGFSSALLKTMSHLTSFLSEARPDEPVEAAEP